MARTYSTSVIPGDGIGKEVMPEGIRVLDRGASLYGFSIEQTWQDFACCELWPTRPDDAGRLEGTNWISRRHFLRRGGLARFRSRSCVAMGFAAPVPARI